MVEIAGNGIDSVSLLLETSSPRRRIACDRLHFRSKNNTFGFLKGLFLPQ